MGWSEWLEHNGGVVLECNINMSQEMRRRFPSLSNTTKSNIQSPLIIPAKYMFRGKGLIVQ
ncbi:MAG: hypothetical protein EBS66_10620 [Betaproteobacteria bacterium]|nr:hypothetical protein [Betaproteobacteria bacterium]